ncbi:microtubule-associated protein RP/EB family member 1 [Platysternon megacephalum]|uniref:Microtubule-associated protein RP/EB family member 1 n=1 Tax=Platysternon megacephalum TaxID=55544 RepID=A0A4D9E1V1_9SAUR|nr:microtubule-associated protein RP/EB family member 1 [Platysternon megacephalum]
MISSWEREEESLISRAARVPNLQSCEEKEILSGTCADPLPKVSFLSNDSSLDSHFNAPGDGIMSENEEYAHQEGPELMEPCGTLSGISQRNISQSPEQSKACEGQHRSERHQTTAPEKRRGEKQNHSDQGISPGSLGEKVRFHSWTR